jgi:glyoxylase I family protein
MADPAPIRVVRIDHVVLRVRDLERSLAFYTGVLGCAEERRLPDVGLVQLRAGDALIDLVPVDGTLGRAGGAPPGRGGRNVDHVALRVDTPDPAALHADLERRGLAPTPLERRYGAEGYGLSLYLEDPDGNTIELRVPPVLGPASLRP